MDSIQSFDFFSEISPEIFIDQIMKLHARISKLESPRNSEEENKLLADKDTDIVPDTAEDFSNVLTMS
ncbi:unnamed protein product [Lupinus luteus]|uniref:Uncharacterized protein n=1 Tax=Lupinus luteus TaxID=3873 RepID=A0AAV1XKE7_LUPLU